MTGLLPDRHFISIPWSPSRSHEWLATDWTQHKSRQHSQLTKLKQSGTVATLRRTEMTWENALKNKTNYLRLQQYDKVWLLSFSLIALWMPSECHLLHLKSHLKLHLRPMKIVCSNPLWLMNPYRLVTGIGPFALTNLLSTTCNFKFWPSRFLEGFGKYRVTINQWHTVINYGNNNNNTYN